MAGVSWFIHTNDPAYLAEFAGQGVTDADGVFNPFEVRENVLYRLNSPPRRPSNRSTRSSPDDYRKDDLHALRTER